VVIESVLSRTGCISQASIFTSPDPRLSTAALFAVMGWHYTLTMLGDKPLPTMMTVTVAFFP